MDTITRTFPIKLTSAYTAGSIVEFCHFRDMLFDADERVSVYLESFFCNLNLKSFLLGVIAEFDGDESEAEKMAKFTVAESRSQKLGLRILNRKNNTGDWEEIAEIIFVNRGRKDYFDLLQPYLAKNQVAILEKNDALAIQLIDYGNGLLKEGDSLRIVSGVTITISKKNDVEALQARISALELALEGKLTNLPSNSLLGRDVNTGVVEVISQAKFATPAQIDQAIINLVGGAPGALNTLIELASALNNDANFASTITNQLALKANASELVNYISKSQYNFTFDVNNFQTGIQGADLDLGEGLSGWHVLTCLRSNNLGFGVQLAMCDLGSRIKYRRKAGGIWSSWSSITLT